MSDLNGNTKVRERTLRQRPLRKLSSVFARAGAAAAEKAFAIARSLSEPPRQTPKPRPRAIISGRHPSRFWYGKSARGKWNPAYRVTEGMKHNEYIKTGKITPKIPPIMHLQPPSIVKGAMKAAHAIGQRIYWAAELMPDRITARQGGHGTPHLTLVPCHDPAIHGIHRPADVQQPQMGHARQEKDGGVAHISIHPDYTPSISLSNHPSDAPQTLSVHHDSAPAIVPAPDAPPHGTHHHLPKRTAHSIIFAYQPEAAWATFVPNSRVASGWRKDPLPRKASLSGRSGASVVEMKGQPRRDAKADMIPGISGGPRRAERSQETAARTDTRKEDGASALRLEVPAIKSSAARPHIQSGPEDRHIGYIPSVKRKSLQLKVAQGADGIPPR